MYEDLTQREMEVLFYIKSFIESNGYPPTVREICAGKDIKSTSTVHYALANLENKNYIRRRSSKTRAIEIVDMTGDNILEKKKTVDIPIVGTVTAGIPILAVENISDTFPLPADFVRDRDLFILKVQGDSMINVGIYSGDYVIIEKRSTANNGDIVLALIEDESTIKTFYKEEARFRLQPENDTMKPIYVQNVDILGLVIGLFRKF